MSNRKALIFIVPLIAMVLLACRAGNVTLNRQRVQGSGDVKTEARSFTDIERVTLTGTGDMTIIQGNEEGLTIEAEDNLLPLIETEMRGRELVIGFKDGVSIQNTKPIRYTLKVKTLSQIAVSGAGNVNADALDTGDLSLEITGSGNMNIADLIAEDLTVRTSGAGDYDLTGEAQTAAITITGAGNFAGGELKTASADVTISGSGNVTVWVAEKLDIRITGFGDVSYYGQPTISQSISGSGKVKSLGEK